MSSRIDDIIARAQSKANPPVKKEEEMPDYRKDFGHEAEDFVAHILKNEGRFVEAVEKGTRRDDFNKKVDIWIKFYEIAEPLGIQLTISDNEDKIQDKIDTLEERKWVAKREKTEGSKIDWVGEVNVVMVRLKKNDIVKLWEKSKEKRTSELDKEISRLVGEIYRQIFEQLGRINQLKKNIYYKVFEDYFKKNSNKKG